MQAVGTGGERGQGHGRDVVALAGAVAGIDENRQVRELLDWRDDRQVQRVAAVVGEGPHAAFAEDHLIVAAGEDVLGRHQPFFEGGRHASLEQHRLPRPGDPPQQAVILHVASANLDDVGGLLDGVGSARCPSAR